MMKDVRELRDSLEINDSDAGTNWKNHHMDELDNNLGDSCARVSIFKKESIHRHSTTVPKTSYSCNRMSKRKAIPVTHGPLAALPALFEMFQDFWICDALGHIGPSTVSPCHTKKLWQIAAQADGMDGPNPFLPNDLPHDLPQLLGIRCSACTAEILQGLELSSPQKDAWHAQGPVLSRHKSTGRNADLQGISGLCAESEHEYIATSGWWYSLFLSFTPFYCIVFQSRHCLSAK